jgi:hypothetical protein
MSPSSPTHRCSTAPPLSLSCLPCLLNLFRLDRAQLKAELCRRDPHGQPQLKVEFCRPELARHHGLMGTRCEDLFEGFFCVEEASELRAFLCGHRYTMTRLWRRRTPPQPRGNHSLISSLLDSMTYSSKNLNALDCLPIINKSHSLNHYP